MQKISFKKKIILLGLVIIIIILITILFSLFFKKNIPNINNDAEQEKYQQKIEIIKTEEKKELGLPDVSNIEVTSRDQNGFPTSYRILTGPEYLDSDNDGLTDSDEKRFGTDPNNSDTDGDEISDWQELSMGNDPKTPNDYKSK